MSAPQLRIAPGTADHYTGPIRSLPEVARIMRESGDTTMTAGTAWTIEQRALHELRPLLESYREGHRRMSDTRPRWFNQVKAHAATLDAIERGVKRLCITSPTGSGKCLAPETPVMLHDGRILDAHMIEVGDLLMGPDSFPRRVLSLARGTSPMYRVTPVKGEPFVCNDAHILSLKMTGGSKHSCGFDAGGIVNIPLSEYLHCRTKTFRHCAKLYRVPVEFPSQFIPLDPYFLGLWLGDGDSMTTTITTADPEIVNWLAHHVSAFGLRLKNVAKEGTCPRYNIVHPLGRAAKPRLGANAIRASLMELGLLGRTHVLAHNRKFIPECYLFNTRAVRLLLLAGILDTDGYVDGGQGYVIGLANPVLADDCVRLARSLGLAAYLKPKASSWTYKGIKKTGDAYVVTISGDCSIIPVRLPHKRVQPRQQKKDVLVTGIQSIERLGTGDYCGWELSGDGLFLLGDFTVTHNTTIYTDALEWAVSEGKTASLFTHRKLLFSQICRNLTRDGIPFGMVASGQERDISKPVQAIMVQTELSRRKRGYESAPSNIVLVDEYHQFGGDRFQEILQEHIDGGATMIGYSATPLDLVNIDELHVAATVPEMQAMGALVVADTYAPDEPDLRHIKNYQVGEDLTEKENTKAIMRPGVFARVVAAWREHNPDGLPTLLFGPDVAGSKFFAEQFHRAGIRAAHIDGDDVWLDGETLSSTQDVRDRLLAEYREGTIKVICNRFVMREGIDLPETGCMIFATVFGALSSYLQAGGRGLRACPERNKDKCICLDHGGNWHRHGSLNAARDWTLGMTNHRVVGERQERMREGQEPQPIVCPKCGKVRLSGRECPSCHFVAHKRSRMVVQIDGTLRPVEGDIYKPHRVKQYPNTAQLWQRMYYRAKNSRKGMTFRQAEALFLVENHYWPPRDLPFMPREPGDFWRKVSAVPSDSLL